MFRDLKKIYILTLGVLLYSGFGFALKNKIEIAELEEDFWHDFHLKFDQTKLNAAQIQSLTHYSHPELKDNVINTAGLKQKIKDVGTATVGKIINRAICKEVDYSKTYYVFYHGCKIEFLIFQDLIKFLHQTMTKKVIKDFVFFRIPTKEYSKYSSAKHFLQESDYCVYDGIDPARKLLLSVNPSLFGNSVHRSTSSAFCYFLSSKSAFSIDSLDLIKDIFDHYKLTLFFDKYEAEIKDLYCMLTDFEKNKTGILLQLFIPKDYVDDIVYRSLPGGVPYYSKWNFLCQKPSIELDAYQKNSDSMKLCSSSYIDEMQFRVLLKKQIMLDPDNKNPVKMFRYLNKTSKIVEYKDKFKKLTQEIAQDLSKLTLKFKDF